MIFEALMIEATLVMGIQACIYNLEHSHHFIFNTFTAIDEIFRQL
jgi:hypothetical protein